MTEIRGIGERGLFDKIVRYLSAAAGVDDAAVLADGDGFVVASSDMFVEGVHFDLSWMSAEDAGWRALALALGDLAAKGATPAWALTSLAVPSTWQVEHVEGLYRGMSDLGRKTGVEIVGGDMSTTDGPAVLALAVTGRTERRPLQRSDAKAGWSVGVTGPLGGAAVALREKRVFRLEPRIDEGRRLNALGLCCGDISDGLVREMEKFAEMAGVGCALEAERVPRARHATVEEALTGGEEAQLVCVGPEATLAGASLAVIGRLTETRAVEVAGVRLERGGYDHFA